MLEASFIGDEITAGGFSLVGIRTRRAPDDIEALWRLILAECERRQLIMLSAACAGQVRARLDRLIEAQPIPPIVVLPDDESAPGFDSAITDALTTLGIEAPAP